MFTGEVQKFWFILVGRFHQEGEGRKRHVEYPDDLSISLVQRDLLSTMLKKEKDAFRSDTLNFLEKINWDFLGKSSRFYLEGLLRVG